MKVLVFNAMFIINSLLTLPPLPSALKKTLKKIKKRKQLAPYPAKMMMRAIVFNLPGKDMHR